MFVMLLGSFTYAQTEREIRLAHIQTLTSTNTTITHSDDTLYVGDVFTVSNGIDSSVHRPALGSPNFTLYGYVEDLQGYYLTTFYATIQNLVNGLQASYSRTDELENLGNGIVTVEVTDDIINGEIVGYVTTIKNDGNVIFDQTFGVTIDNQSDSGYAYHLSNITNLVNDRILFNERSSILISIVEAHIPMLSNITTGYFDVNTGPEGSIETSPSWGIQYYFSVNGVSYPLLLTVHNVTGGEFLKLEHMRHDQFEDFVDAFTSQTGSSMAISDKVFDFNCN